MDKLQLKIKNLLQNKYSNPNLPQLSYEIQVITKEGYNHYKDNLQNEGWVLSSEEDTIRQTLKLKRFRLEDLIKYKKLQYHCLAEFGKIELIYDLSKYAKVTYRNISKIFHLEIDFVNDEPIDINPIDDIMSSDETEIIENAFKITNNKLKGILI